MGQDGINLKLLTQNRLSVFMVWGGKKRTATNDRQDNWCTLLGVRNTQTLPKGGSSFGAFRNSAQYIPSGVVQL
jgi:hypothetical protein